MYPDRFRLPFLAGVLIAAAERRRPALGPWSPESEEQLRHAFDSELDDVRRSFLESFDDPGWFARVEEKLEEVALPRYLAEARRETDLEQRGYGLWRGGDLVSRIVWGLGGFLLGVFLVKAPFIPIPTTWDLLAFGDAAPLPLHPRPPDRPAPSPAPPRAPGHRRGPPGRRGPARRSTNRCRSPESPGTAIAAPRASVRQKG